MTAAAPPACLPEILRAALPLTVIILTFLVPFLLYPLPKSFKSIFTPFLTLQEIYPEKTQDEVNERRLRIVTWKLRASYLLGGLATIAWALVSVWVGLVEAGKEGKEDVDRYGILALLNAAGWIYPTLLPVLAPSPNPTTSLILIYFAHIGVSTYNLYTMAAGSTFSEKNFPALLLWVPVLNKSQLIVVAPTVLEALNALKCAVLLCIQFSLPINVLPKKLVESNSEKLTANQGQGTSPEDSTSLFNIITCSWFNPLIRVGQQKPALEQSDVWELSPTLTSELLFSKWDEVVKAKGGSLFWSICRTNSLFLIQDCLLTIIMIALEYFSPYCTKQIIDALADPTNAKVSRAVGFAAIAFTASLLRNALNTLISRYARQSQLRVRSQLITKLYIKALKRKDLGGAVNKDDSKGAGSGKVLQMMQGDSGRISVLRASRYISAPIKVVVCCTFLYQLLGVSAFAGIILIFVTGPLNGFLFARWLIYARAMRIAKDTRLKMMNELIASIKQVKFFAWESKYKERVLVPREEEFKNMRGRKLLHMGINALYSAVPKLLIILSFLTYTSLFHQELTLGTAFTALSLFNMLSMPITTYAQWIVFWKECMLSIERIEAFLSEAEVPDYVSTLELTKSGGETKLEITGATFKWPSGTVSETPSADEDDKVALANISVKFPEEKLTVVSGPTGSGKTALLLATLGEMDLVEGSISIPKDSWTVDENGLTNSLAYCGQTAWLQNKTIKENIIFGSVFDQSRYQDVVKACALEVDLSNLEDGDETEVGPKGVTLSGGQKARLALARALYTPAKYLLIDDCLAAVDSHTGDYLVKNALTGSIVKGRTVVIVSHHVDLLLPVAHSVIQLVDGKIAMQGTVEELRSNGVLKQLIAEEEALVKDQEPAEAEGADSGVKEKKGEPAQAAKKLVKDEEKAKGKVQLASYLAYFKAFSYTLGVIYLLLTFISKNSDIPSNVWVTQWTSHYQSAFRTFTTTNLPESASHPLFYLAIYAAINLGSVLLDTIRDYLSFVGSIRAARIVHNSMLDAVLGSPIRMFDNTPAGRIVNRFSNDQESVDLEIVDSIKPVLGNAFELIGSVILISTVLPYFLIVALILFFLSLYLANQFAQVGRDLKRMNSVNQSPLIDGFTQVLDGIVSIRAFGAERRFLKSFYTQIHKSQQFSYMQLINSERLEVRFGLIAAVTILFTNVALLATGTAGGWGAIALLSAQALVSAVNYICMSYSQVEVSMSSLERVLEYTRLPQERYSDPAPPAYWPSSSAAGGENNHFIEVKDLQITYAPDLPPSLKGISFSLKYQEKVGLVGRTGSGKSTLGQSFLRFVDPLAGSIVIDGLDITKVSLEAVRSRITLIPQDAVLFTGTLRTNLDPFSQYDDEELRDAIKRVHLKLNEGEAAEDVKLDQPVSASGGNFSQGQRQLIAMARALLRRNNIVIMDEATSSVDFQTDELIQATIREQFKDSCIITVAHRLSSVIDYDRLIVLEAGKIVEFDTPWALLQKEDGVFKGMCEKSGSNDELRAAAKKKHDQQSKA